MTSDPLGPLVSAGPPSRHVHCSFTLKPTAELSPTPSILPPLEGPAAKGLFAQPHPKLARLVSLRVGTCRWAVSRNRMKAQLSRRDHNKARGVVQQANSKWTRHSELAAAGLEKLHWQDIRKVVGLTPWGEQVLLRVKHHAMSTYDPVTAGFHCPHGQCTKAARVDLHHVFWECPAARQMRKVLLLGWQAAGVGKGTLEEEIFSLKLARIPQAILAITGRILTDCVDGGAEAMGGEVEQIIQQCWRIDVALYFHCVWRWRVAHFDNHNDVSEAHHRASYTTRMKNAHMDIARVTYQEAESSSINRARRAICRILGSRWPAEPASSAQDGAVYLVFHAGKLHAGSEAGIGGTMVVRAAPLTGLQQVLYFTGTVTQGRILSGMAATHMGLLRGLRACKRYGWNHVHVVGDNQVVLGQHKRRVPPSKAKPATLFWTARRVADSVGVTTWSYHPRERNKTAHAAIEAAATTQQNVEWTATQDSTGGAQWAAVLRHARHDVEHWWSTHGDTVLDAQDMRAV